MKLYLIKRLFLGLLLAAKQKKIFLFIVLDGFHLTIDELMVLLRCRVLSYEYLNAVVQGIEL